MKKFNFIYSAALMLIAAILFSACSSSTEEYLNVIPKDAGIVVTFNFKSMSEKGKLDKITESKMYQAMKPFVADIGEKAVKEVEALLKDPSSLGVDFKSDVVMFLTNDMKYVAFAFKMGEAGKLDAFLAKMEKEFGAPIKTTKEGDVTLFKDENMVTGWDAGKLLVLMSIAGEDPSAKFKECMAAKEDQSIASIEDFQKFYEKKKDINMWMSMEIIAGINEFNAKMGTTAMVAMPANFPLKDNYVHFYVDFATDEILCTGEYVPSEEYLKKFKPEEMMKDGMTDAMLNQIPQNKAIAVASFAINFKTYFEAIKQFLPKEFDLAMVEQQLSPMGLKMDDIMNFFGGEILFTFNGMKKISVIETVYTPGLDGKEGTYDSAAVEKDIPMFTLSLSVNDDKLYKKLIEILPAMAGDALKPRGKNYEFDIEGVKVYAGLQNKIFIVTNCEEIIDGAEKGFGNESLKGHAIAADMKSHPAYFYMNLNYETYPNDLKALIEGSFSSKEEFGLFMKITSVLDKMTLKSTKKSEMTASLKFKDKKENSLYTLFQMIDQIVAASMPM